MILNEYSLCKFRQLIEDMFQDEPSMNPPSLPREDISLNLTNTSRSNKHNKPSQLLPQQITATAEAELAKFEAWMQAQTEHLVAADLPALIQKIEAAGEEVVEQQDLMIIKGELFRHEEQPQRCPDCAINLAQLRQLQNEAEQQHQTLEQRNKELAVLQEANVREAVGEVREYLLAEVENNALRSEIKELHAEINALRNEKITLERTFLFNKTRNSDASILQKSKDLSAAKNSTNSSEILGRHEAIVFIDPIESDVEEWIRFFEAQKSRYRLLSRREAEERQKELGRPLSREEREAFEASDRPSLLLQSIKEILTHLQRIREHTAAFEQTDLGRSGQQRAREEALREETQRLHWRLAKALKLNESLLREKRNLEEIGMCLQQQRLRDSHQRNALAELLRREAARVRELEESARQASLMLMQKEEQLLYAIEEIKKLRRENAGDKQWTELQGKCRILEKKYQQKLKEYEFQRNSYIFKLKKEALERRRYCNQLEEMKGVLRIYLRMPTPNDLEPSSIYKIVPDGHQERVYEDIKRLIAGALDGFSLTVFNYGHPESSKAHFLHGDEHAPPTALRVLRQVFRLIEAEKDFRVEPSLSVCEVTGERIADLTDPHSRSPENREQSLSFAQLPQVGMDSLESTEEALECAMGRRKGREKGHLVLRVGLQVHNLKTNEKYRSRITLVDLAEPDRMLPNDPREHSANTKGMAALSKCILAFGSKEKLIPCREHKFTQALKDCFNPSSRIVVLVNVAATASREEIRQAVGFAEACKVGRREESEDNRARKSISRKNI